MRIIVCICCACGRMRGKSGDWVASGVGAQEAQASELRDCDCSHGICPDCLRFLYPEFSGIILRDRPELKGVAQGNPG